MGWMSYPEPKELHDYSHLGKDFRERERIKKKIKRNVDKLKKLPALERGSLIEALNEID